MLVSEMTYNLGIWLIKKKTSKEIINCFTIIKKNMLPMLTIVG